MAGQVEYKVLTITPTNGPIVVRDDDHYFDTRPSLHTYLNELAAQGWRVVGLSGAENEDIVILVREK